MTNEVNQHGFPMDIVERTPTPFYYYDMNLLKQTVEIINRQISGMPFIVHYALKANNNPQILKMLSSHGLGADVVSGGEIQAAITHGFKPEEINFSGVAKTDWEIKLGLEVGIGCFNVESPAELDVINELAGQMGKKAPVGIRVNPDIDAHTHQYITTGTAATKFGTDINELGTMVAHALSLPHVDLLGLHFHIGSQITQMQPFITLCETVNKLLDEYERQGIHFPLVNMGGGLGIDYSSPDQHPIAPFQDYFDVFKTHLVPRQGQQVHFELGRSVVAPCGSLLAHVIYVKENRGKHFALIDAGMNDLIRPALYGAEHVVQNLTSRDKAVLPYDVAGPVCESSDVFATDCPLPVTRRGDLIAIRSAGAYGESMASTYNMRPLPASVFFPESIIVF